MSAEPRLTNSLTAAADELQRVNQACDQAERDAIDHAMSAGRLLCEAKEQCPHGHWLPFLARAGVPERKAQRLMKLHRGRLDSDFVSLLGGVAPALTFLGLRDRAMAHLDDAERWALRFEASGEDEDDMAGLKSMEMALGYIDAMVCCYPAEAVAGSAFGRAARARKQSIADGTLISQQQAAEVGG